jgi:probable F420-dependent oxidoreductase
MNTLQLGPIGIALDVAADNAHLDAGAEIEDLGYDTIWVAGGQLDRLDRIDDLVRATRTIAVIPGIISVDVYPPEVVARWHAELVGSTAPDRFVVGIGGPQQPRPLGPLGRYLDVLDAADPPVPAERRILAALGPRKLELARERAGGAVPLLVDPAYTAWARTVLGERATLVVDQMIVLDDDPARARETARGPLRFLSRVGGYRDNFVRMGFTATEIDQLSDRLVDELVAWGDEQTISERVRAHHLAGADQVALAVLHEEGQPGPLEAARTLAAGLLR